IWMSSAVHSYYFPRTSFRNLARQYWQYGVWRIRTIQKHRRPATVRQVVPLAFVLTFSTLLVTTPLWTPAAYAFAMLCAVYLTSLLAGAIQATRRATLPVALAVPFALAIMHFSYGLGSIKGVFRFILLRQVPTPADAACSRKGLAQ